VKENLQDNVITLLCYDDKMLPLLRSVVDAELFDTAAKRKIVKEALGYYHQFRKPIGDHLADVLDDELAGKNKEIYEDLLYGYSELSKTINREFVMTELEKFIRQQELKLSIKEAADLVVEDKLDEAEEVLRKSRNKQLKVFNPGISLAKPDAFLSFLDKEDEEIFPIGIPHLDLLKISPARKELFVFLALPNAGKSWFLINAVRNALMRQLKVVHITLEMSEEKVAKRYLQNLFAISNSDNEVDIPKFEFTENGDLRTIQYIRKKVKSYKDADIKRYLMERTNRFRYNNLVIKEFPTRSLTIKGLRSYLDNLINYYGFIPDILALDYPDLMRVQGTGWEALSQLYADIRGIAVEYNIAVLAVTQSNREGKLETWLTDYNLSGDYTKAAIADNLITYNQSMTENLMRMARLYNIKARNERKGDKIAITQQYQIGQFCLNSYFMNSAHDKYFDFVKSNTSEDVLDPGIQSKKKLDQKNGKGKRKKLSKVNT